MALSHFRLPWNVIKQNQLNYNRLIILGGTSQQVDVRRISTERQKISPSSYKLLRNSLTCALIALSGVGYLLYKRKDDILDEMRQVSIRFPSARALSIPPSNLGQNRQKYNFIADVVEISAGSVVYIEIIDERKVDFFTGRHIPASNGSGFIVAPDGLILTNAHVVINKPHTTVKVRLHDGNVYTGVVEDVDMHSDLATVRINKTNLPVMKLGSSSNIRPGEFVVAIGSPLALSNTITSGVISSVQRPSEELGIFHKQMNYIQTDAAITFGNSGGPLVNLDGEAIGINSMKVTAGISFAIPIDYAKDFLHKAEQRRKGRGAANVRDEPKRRYLGITMVSLTPDLLYEIQQRSGQIPDFVRHGVLIYKVVFGSPAHLGGLQAGDIVTHLNGEEVYSAMTVYQALEKPGKLKLTIVRNGQRLVVTVNPEDI